MILLVNSKNLKLEDFKSENDVGSKYQKRNQQEVQKANVGEWGRVLQVHEPH